MQAPADTPSSELASWTPPPRPHRRVLHGRFVRVEPLEAERHCDDLHAAFSADPEHLRWEYRFQSGFATRADLLAYLVSIETSTAAYYGVYVDLTTGKAAGLGSLMSIDQLHGSIEIGAIMLAPSLSRTAAGTEALILQIRWAFSLGYRRVEWTCDPHNAASMRAAQRLGFSFELTQRQRHATKGRNRDKACFAICDGAEWAAVDAQQRAWLEPTNFDDAGQQRQALSTLTAPLLRCVAAAEPSAHSNANGQPSGAPLRQRRWSEDEDEVRWCAGWVTPPRPVRKTLSGEYVSCVPLTLEHAKPLGLAFNTMLDSPYALWDHLSDGPFPTRESFNEWLGRQSVSTDPLWFALEVRGEECDARGLAAFRCVDEAHGTIEVGPLIFGFGLARTRAATEAVFLLLNWAFKHGYRRVVWQADAHHAASCNAAERHGFVLEGISRQHRVIDKRTPIRDPHLPFSRDTAWYSMLDREWWLIHHALYEWLGSYNFGPDGKQKERLESYRDRILARSDGGGGNGRRAHAKRTRDE